MLTHTSAQIREHYEIEKEIAERLRNASGSERTLLYTWAYDELFRRVPHHPLLVKRGEAERWAAIEKEVKTLQRFLNKDSVYLEVGPGDCGVAIEVAKRVKKVFAIDVSKEITRFENAPPNFELIISDGTDIGVPPDSVDFAYSNQLMEHLHADDAAEQLLSIYRALRPGGIYYCITPNRLSGPHDVSRSFDAFATGLHLKEYTITELDRIFRKAGFSKIRINIRIGSREIIFPFPFMYKIIEKTLDTLPNSTRKFLTFNRGVRFLLGIRLVGTK